jgi:hypothetical protein
VNIFTFEQHGAQWYNNSIYNEHWYDVNKLGDEFHYLFKCTFFNNVRAKYLPRNICNNPNVLKF